MNRTVVRGFVNRQYDLASLEIELAARNSSWPWKQDRNAATKRMLAQGFDAWRRGDYLERTNPVAEALASEFRGDDDAFALGFDSYKIHD